MTYTQHDLNNSGQSAIIRRVDAIDHLNRVVARTTEEKRMAVTGIITAACAAAATPAADTSKSPCGRLRCHDGERLKQPAD